VQHPLPSSWSINSWYPVHFFFPRRNDDDKDEDRKGSKEDDCATESFKNNRVLIALAEGRLPDERPNYEYFARLLAGDSETYVRPKTCWIYVSSSDVKMSDDGRKAHSVDGTYMDSDAYAADGTRLDGKGDYPHLVLNSNKDYKRDLNRDKESSPNYLLHEYTRTISQKESSSVKEIASRWDHRFPELREKLESALDDTHPSHERTSRCVVGPCDTFHFEVVLDLHATSQFPSGTHINGVVQLSICRPDLANHSWRSVTSVAKPAHLENEREPRYWDSDDQCDLTGRGNSRDTIEVPFPASSWANTFIKLAPYVRAEREKKERERMNGSRSSKAKREDGDDTPHKSSKTPTPKDLLSQVAMYQEIWSAPNDGSEKPRWTRRAVVLWTFANSTSKVDAKGKVSTVPAGTSWRFLTKLDPTSQYHQQRAYVSGSPTVSRDSVMSPNPPYAHHLQAAMHDNFNSAYDAPASFDSATMASADSFQQQPLSYLSQTTNPDSQPGMVAAANNDSFLSGLGVPVSTYDEPECTPNLQSWASASQDSLQNQLDSTQWTTTSYADSQQSLAWADHNLPPGSADMVDSQQQQQQQQHQQQQQQQWQPTSRGTTPWHDNSAWSTPNMTAAVVPQQQSWIPVPAGARRPLQRTCSGYSEADCASYLASSTSSSIGGDMNKGRKRMRSEDLNDDEGDGYPLQSIRKLTHSVEPQVQSFRM
jgi:transcriptional enhancer factor